MRFSACRVIFVLACSALPSTGIWPSHLRAEEPYQIAWIRQFDDPEAHTIVVDDAGGVHLGVGSSIRKYNSAGELQSILDFLAPADAFAYDSNGNIYACAAELENWGGPTAGQADAVVSKLDPQGNTLWIRKWGGVYYDSCEGVGVDDSDNVYVGGYDEFYRAFVRKLDPLGNELWVRKLEHSSQGHALAVDPMGNAFITGYGDVGGPRVGGDDAFVAKYNSSGQLGWATKLASNQSEIGYGVTFDSNGNSYTTGFTEGQMGLSRDGAYDVFVAKVDPNGSRIWTAQFGANFVEFDQGHSIAVAENGDIFVAGETTPETTPDFAGGSPDAFVAKLNASGELQWTINFASEDFNSSQIDIAWAVSVDSQGNVFLAGDTRGSIGGANAGQIDGFLVKLVPIPEPSTIGLCLLAATGIAVQRVVRKRRAHMRSLIPHHD